MRSIQTTLFAAVFAATLLSRPAAGAAGVPGKDTYLRSTADRMISFRHQKHSWVSSDSQYHLLYNRGYQTSGASLDLVSSTDGVIWTPDSVPLKDSDEKSTADGSWNESLRMLSVVYSTAKGGINFASIKYDSGSKAWKLKGAGQTVRLGSKDDKVNFAGKPALIPTVLEDADGDFWCVFVELNITDTKKNLGTAALKLYHRAKDGNTWSDTGLAFGAAVERDMAAPKISGRLVRTPRSIGLVFSDGADILWAERPVDGLATGDWFASQTLIPGTPDSEADNDPYASHYSVATDDQGNIHLAYADAKIPYYRRFNALSDGGPVWSDSSVAFSKTPIETGYTEVSYLGGSTIAVVFNAQTTNEDGTKNKSNLRVWQSAARGGPINGQTSWVCTDVLTHLQADDNNKGDFKHMRNEMPAFVPPNVDALVLLQHKPIEDNASIYAALSYRFPVGGNAGCKK